jgi:hypothetical protein
VTIPEHHHHQAQVKLKTRSIWNIDDRITEVAQIRVWLDELTDWQPDAYSMKYYTKDNVIDVWFEQEQHAVACALKWS